MDERLLTGELVPPRCPWKLYTLYTMYFLRSELHRTECRD